MATTTQDEFPSKPVPKTDNKVEKEILARYNKGENLYKIAHEVYGFTGEEVITKVRQVIGMDVPKAND